MVSRSRGPAANDKGGRGATDRHQAFCDKGALALYSGERLVGAFEAGHAEDANLTADVLLENLAAKVTAAHSLGSLLNALKRVPTKSISS